MLAKMSRIVKELRTAEEGTGKAHVFIAADDTFDGAESTLKLMKGFDVIVVALGDRTLASCLDAPRIDSGRS